MKVELEKTFPMPAPPEAAWAFLKDIEGVAGCMPGAKITERIDAAHFKGTISVRVGPASMSFRGEIEVHELDVSQRMLHLIGKGSDTTGTSGASMDLVARIEPNAADGMSQLIGRSELTMSGKAAAFGGRMLGTVADQILKQFAANFAAQVQARAATDAAAANTASSRVAPPAAPTSSTAAVPTPTPAPLLTSPPAAPISSTAAVPTPTPAPLLTSPRTAPTPPAPELNALTLLWAIVRDWFRGLFRRRAA